MGFFVIIRKINSNDTVRYLSDRPTTNTLLKANKWLSFNHLFMLQGFKSRDEATRTPDPYVPNVVRYQLRYIPILRVQSYAIFLNYVQEKE